MIRMVNGWLVVPYAGPELTTIELATGRGGPGEFRGAFLDYVNGERVAKIRPTEPVSSRTTVWLRVSGVVTPAGRVVA